MLVIYSNILFSLNRFVKNLFVSSEFIAWREVEILKRNINFFSPARQVYYILNLKEMIHKFLRFMGLAYLFSRNSALGHEFVSGIFLIAGNIDVSVHREVLRYENIGAAYYYFYWY